MAEAKKKVKKIDIEEYKRKAEKYVKEKDFSDQANEEMRLYNLTIKVNRLELLKANIGAELVNGTNELQTYYGDKLDEEVMKELERNASILGPSVLDNAKNARIAVDSSFQNATWSERVWNNQTLLKNSLSNIISNALIQGKNPRDFISQIRKQFDVSRYQAERLLRTEIARAQVQAQAESYTAEDIEEYEYVACGKKDCCPVCKKLDGKIFKVKDMECGENAPPMHPNCHCATAPYLDRKEYDEWLDGYKDHGLTFEEWKETNQITRYKAVKINSQEQLKNLSKSSIIDMKSIDEIKQYFDKKYSISVEGFDNKTLLQVQAPLCGVDDILSMFPKVNKGIKNIVFVPKVNNYYGEMNSNGTLNITKRGLQDYGTGLHEASHALDYVMSSNITKDEFSSSIVKEALKTLKLRRNSLKLDKLLGRLSMPSKEFNKDAEVFAYAMESELGGNSSILTRAIYDCTRRKFENE